MGSVLAKAPEEFRRALGQIAALQRDAWFDALLGQGAPPPDDSTLPRGCVPYLPCPIDAIAHAVDGAQIGANDLVVDVGSGVGRAAVALHLMSRAQVVGVEIQPRLVSASRELFARLGITGIDVREGDVSELVPAVSGASVYFLYCPFSGRRLERLLDDLRGVARQRTIRLCCVNLPPLERDWLEFVAHAPEDVAIYRSRTTARAQRPRPTTSS